MKKSIFLLSLIALLLVSCEGNITTGRDGRMSGDDVTWNNVTKAVKWAKQFPKPADNKFDFEYNPYYEDGAEAFILEPEGNRDERRDAEKYLKELENDGFEVVEVANGYYSASKEVGGEYYIVTIEVDDDGDVEYTFIRSNNK